VKEVGGAATPLPAAADRHLHTRGVYNNPIVKTTGSKSAPKDKESKGVNSKAQLQLSKTAPAAVGGGKKKNDKSTPSSAAEKAAKTISAYNHLNPGMLF
jgi:hypothetical protein